MARRRGGSSARSGAGPSTFLLLAALLGWLPASAANQAGAGEWIEAAVWPYSHAAEADDDRGLLVIVEQAGIDLEVRLPDDTAANAPLGRMGPEVARLAPGEAAELILEPLHPATGSGRFRITHLPIDEEALDALGRALEDAGRSFGSGDADRRVAACAEYARAAELAAGMSHWQSLARLLDASCRFATGQQTSPTLLDSIDDGYAFFSVLPHHAPWLKAELLHSALAYDQAASELDLALRRATQALTDFPERAIGIRHDIAEIQALMGGTAVMQAFVAGGGEVGDGEARRQRLLDASRERLDEAIAAAKALENAYVLGKAYDFRAAMHFLEEENAEVIDNLLLAKAEIEKTGNPDWLLPVLGSIGDFHKRWGQLRAAQEAYLEALRIVGRNATNGRYADVHHNVGVFYFDIGDLPRARRHIETSIRLSTLTGRETRAFSNSRHLALILERQGDYEAAKALNQELLEYFTRLETESGARSWSPFRIATQAALSRVEHRLGNLAEAWRLSTEVLAQEQARAINVDADVLPVYLNHTEILFARGESSAALALLDDTIERFSNQPIPMIDLLAAKLSLLHRSRSTDEAIAVADQVFAIIESQRTQIDAVRLGPYWSGRTNDIYASHADYLLQLSEDGPNHRARAFEVAERARATSLRLRRLETLLNRNDRNPGAQAEWLRIVSAVQDAAARQRTDEDLLDFDRRLTEARERYFASHGVEPEAASLEVMSLDALRARLPESTVLMHFVGGPDRVWRFDVTRDGWAVTLVGESSEVEASIEAALYELSSPYVRDRRRTVALSELLLAGLSVDLRGKELLISPTTGMSVLPFYALLLDGEHVADLAAISLVPSVSEYFLRGTARETARDGARLDIAVLADPSFGDVAGATAVLADQEAFRSWTDSLSRLPQSALEARDLSRYYAEDRRLLLLGSEATQRNFFDSRVTSARVIHIATHGYFREDLPELIGFAMAKDDPDDDGFVSMAEISAQEFAADLVVISACSTGRGAEIAGEGSMSLARTFLAQGVDSVVSTLWPVSDAATALFMKEFYRALNEDRVSLPRALQSAQRVLRGTSRFRHPFYWSGYTLTVAGRPAT